MKKLRFKTNINCTGCIAKVSNQLDETVGKGNWNVDINNPDKPLTVMNTDKTVNDVSDAIKKAGFKAEPVQELT